jgi:NAD+ synthase
MNIDPVRVTHIIEDFIVDKLAEFKRDGAILGVSGGVDSALTVTLLFRALGSDRVHALLLPERDSSPSSKSDALITLKRLNIQSTEVNLTPILSEIGIYKQIPLQFLGTRRIKETIVRQQHQHQVEALGEQPFLAGLVGTRDLGEEQKVIDTGNAYARIKHRMRMVVLYYYAELRNLMVVGTTNRSEALTGFVVKWGDNVADIEPILPLYKTQVFQLAEHLGVEPEIIAKAPSPDLIPGVVDEFALGIDYPTLDKILWGLDHAMSTSQMIQTYQVSEAQVRHVRELVNRSQHIRQLPPYPDLN